MTDHWISTTMQPDRKIQVSSAELLDLQRMGVVSSLSPFSLDDVPAPVGTTWSTDSEEVDADGYESEAESEADSE